MRKDFFANRWNDGSRERILSGKIINWLSGGRNGIPGDLAAAFQTRNGDLMDFRGLVLEGITIKNLDLVGIDFSFSNFKSTWVQHTKFDQCTFNKVDLSNFSDHGNKFTNCIFSNCKFNYSAIGYKGSVFENCNFDNSNFQKAVFVRAEFVHTNFINCKLRNIDFNASSFEGCVFKGILEDVWFRGNFPLDSDIKRFGKPKQNKMKNVSFENADLRDITFSDGCDLSSVKLKDNNEYYKYDNWAKRLQILDEQIVSWGGEEKQKAEIFVKTYMVHAENQNWNIVSLYNLEKYYGIEVASKIIQTLNCIILPTGA